MAPLEMPFNSTPALHHLLTLFDFGCIDLLALKFIDRLHLQVNPNMLPLKLYPGILGWTVLDDVLYPG